MASESVLMSISEVHARFGLPISTLHYWERSGLLEPERRSGVRFYDINAVYRIALIQLWRDTGMMSLSDIKRILASNNDAWRDVVAAQIEILQVQAHRLERAESYLRHLLTCRQENALEHCPEFRASVEIPASSAG